MSVIKILLADDQGVTRVVDPRRLAPGATARIEALPNARYILVDAETGKAPLDMVVRRHGDDLWIGADGDASPSIQIADYYGSGGSLLAEGADGQYYSYDGASIGVSTLADDAVATLALPGATAPEAAAGNAAGGPDWTPLGLGALGLAAVAAGVAVASSGSSNSVRSIPGDAAARDDMAGAPVIRHLLADAEGGGRIESAGMTNDPRPSLVGTGNTPGDAILVYVDGSLAGATTVAPDGSWSFPIPAEQPLTAGAHSLSAIEVGENGKGGPVSDPFAVVIGPPMPSRPLFDWVIDDVEPGIVGTAAAGYLVYLYENAQDLIGSVRADGQGRWSYVPDHDLDEGVHAFSVIAEGPNGEMLGPSNIYVIEIEDAWYRLDTLFDPPLTDDAATEAAMHATARDVPPDRHVADAASAVHEAPALAVEPAKSAQRHGEDVSDVDRTGSQTPAEAFRPAMQVSPHEHEVAAGGEPAWLAASCQADRMDGLKLSLSDLLQDGAPDLFPADGSLEKTAASTDAGAPDLPGLKGDISDARTSSDAAPAGVAHLAYGDGMPLMDWSVSHGIDVHST
ncbi:Ig-like domain-containing protein [Burkholderia gladioli]|uniref:Ig-like domain-containing protein n=1 Tax=Burkholderia gladioli TaxID=28095 RepID=UPI0016401647|nr:Ig-like domain-containing protein [Burkholderia gladioli]